MKGYDGVGWYQPVPVTSLEMFRSFNIPTSAHVIDVGGGAGYLVDHLLAEGYRHLTVLDISQVGLQQARTRIGLNPAVDWIVEDITAYEPASHFDVWHDRATFHFLISEPAQMAYLDVMHRAVRPGGLLILGTFADDGPDRCSGLPVTRYSEATMGDRLAPHFEPLHFQRVEHYTPTDHKQKYLFGVFRHSGGN